MLPRTLLTAVAALVAVAALAQTPINLDRIGPSVGATAPDFTLPDASGTPRSLQSLLGPKGALVVFSRSADW